MRKYELEVTMNVTLKVYVNRKSDFIKDHLISLVIIPNRGKQQANKLGPQLRLFCVHVCFKGVKETYIKHSL